MKRKIAHYLPFALFLIASFCAPGYADEPKPDPSVQKQIQELREKLSELEAIVTDPGGKTETAANDIKALKKISFSGFLQARYESFQNSKDGSGTVDQFLVRRARLKMTAKPSSDLAVVLSSEFAGGVRLRDAFITWLPWHAAERGPSLSLGQMDWCFGYEVPTSDTVREAPERVLWARKLFPNEKDQGVKISSVAGRRLFWEAGVYNGTGENKADNNSGKDVVSRARYAVLHNLNLGVSGYWGTTFTPAAGEHPARTTVKNRYGVDGQWVWNNWTLKGEYVKARDLGHSPFGWNAQIARNVGKKTVLVCRYDVYDADGAAGEGYTGTLSSGIIRYLDPKLRAKLFFDMPKERGHEIKNDVLRAELIAVF